MLCMRLPASIPNKPLENAFKKVDIDSVELSLENF